MERQAPCGCTFTVQGQWWLSTKQCDPHAAMIANRKG